VFARPAVICGLLVLATLAVYWPVRTYDFIALDDPIYVRDNPAVQGGLSLHGVCWAFGAGYAGNWHPLTWLSHMLDADLFGPGAAGPHLVNLLLHAVSAAVLFLALRALTGALWRSALVAALFALHPLHVESVAWISERKDVLSGLCWMLTLWAYGGYAQSQSVRAIGDRARCYGLALGCFALGLMSKPMLVTLPCVLLLLDYWPLRRFAPGSSKADDAPAAPAFRRALWPLLKEKIPFFVLSAASCAITVVAQRQGGAIQPMARLSLAMRIENTFVAYARYLGKLGWPTDLALPYPSPGHWPLAEVMGAVALVIGVSALVVWLGRRSSFLVTGWFWFLGTLVPVIGLVQVGEQSLADHYTYVPAIGVFIALVWSAAAAGAHWRLPRWLAGLGAAVLLGLCAGQTCVQLAYWQTSERLLRHALALTQDNWVADFALGFSLSEKGRGEEAIAYYEHALAINPGSTRLWKSLGDARLKGRQYAAAIQCFQRALQLKGDNTDARSNLGLALEESGQRDQAIEQYLEVLRQAPGDALTHFRLGNCLVGLGRTEEAVAQYQLALQYEPNDLEVRNNLGVALFNQGKRDQAGDQFRAVLRAQPGHANARCNLGNVLATQQKWAEAAEQYAEAVRLTPDSAEALYGLARALARLGRRDEAIAELNEVLRLNPAHAGAKQLLKALGGPAPEAR